jgi:sugar/nucleoside kinase (ribokinase family)
LGEEGSLIYCENEFIKTGGYKVPGVCKDTTGAGDSFRAGFLYGLLKNETVETAAKMANAVAALKCREIGARTALPNNEELKRLLNEN